MIGEIPALQTISASVTPVVMLSACGTLTISVNSRQQHLSTMIRAAAAEIRSHSVSPERRSQLREQLVVFNHRFLYSWFASSTLYAAIGSFGLTTLGILATQRRLSQSEPFVLTFFVLGLVLMLVAALCVIGEVALSWRTLRLEMRDLDLPLRRPHTHDKTADNNTNEDSEPDA